jgi:hypothetical protein
MDYTRTYNELKAVFNIKEKVIPVTGSPVCIHNVEFRSDIAEGDFVSSTDSVIAENRSFVYPVFAPTGAKSDKVILLLHGLNERSWVKYLVWALYLAEQTNSYVILFPIAFHINRSPAVWSDPRAMISLMKERNASIGEINKSSFANIALSNRLTEDPMRFFKSGYETTSDIVKLLSAIKTGTHEVIPKTENFNIFAYSIGAFLAEIMMMGNPKNLLSKSKLFIFCGGSVFSNMQGSSKLIMDSLAFNRVYNFYLYDFEETLTGKSPLVEFLHSSQIGMAFRSMIDLERLKNFRENILRNIREQIHSLSLLKDTVIPSKGVISTLRASGKNDVVEVWDFPYTYSHENPFPVLDSPLSKKVDYWFEKVFAEAIIFLA